MAKCNQLTSLPFKGLFKGHFRTDSKLMMMMMMMMIMMMMKLPILPCAEKLES